MSEEKEDNILERIIFKKYKPIKLIGKGGFASVYSCLDILDKKEYAIKAVRNKHNKNHIYKLQEKRVPEEDQLLESEAIISCYLKNCKLINI